MDVNLYVGTRQALVPNINIWLEMTDLKHFVNDPCGVNKAFFTGFMGNAFPPNYHMTRCDINKLIRH